MNGKETGPFLSLPEELKDRKLAYYLRINSELHSRWIAVGIIRPYLKSEVTSFRTAVVQKDPE